MRRNGDKTARACARALECLCAGGLLLLMALPCRGQDAPPARKQILDRLRKIQNITARVEYVTTYNPRKDIPPPNLPGVGPRFEGDYGYTMVFRFLDGHACYDWVVDQKTANKAMQVFGPSFPFRRVEVYTPERAESLNQNAREPAGVGGIHDKRPLPPVANIDVALGLRGLSVLGWITETVLAPAKLGRDAGGRVQMTLAGSGTLMHTWTFDPARDFALVLYTVQSEGHLCEEVVCSDFRAFEGLQLPMNVTRRTYGWSKEKQREVRKLETVRVNQYVPNDPQNTPESFRIAFPPGAHVKDFRDRKGARRTS